MKPHIAPVDAERFAPDSAARLDAIEALVDACCVKLRIFARRRKVLPLSAGWPAGTLKSIVRGEP